MSGTKLTRLTIEMDLRDFRYEGSDEFARLVIEMNLC